MTDADRIKELEAQVATLKAQSEVVKFAEVNTRDLITRAEALYSVTTDEEMEQAGHLAKAPMTDMLYEINMTFNPIIEAQMKVKRAQDKALKVSKDAKEAKRGPVVAARTCLRIAVKEYSERRQEAVQALAARTAKRGQGEVTMVPVPSSTPTPKTGAREHWKVKVLDPSKVAKAYMTPDLVKMGATTRAMGKDAVNVLGGSLAVRVWSEVI